MTAARSRERKKVQWAELEARLAGLEADNGALRAALAKMSAENSGLREQLNQVRTRACWPCGGLVRCQCGGAR